VPTAVEPGLSDVRWELAPIRWRGLLATDMRSFSVEGQAQRRDFVESAILQATSYVYQPWFAQFALGITGIAAQARGEVPSNGNTVGSNGMLNVFPTSRFPFQASFERTDSRSSEQFTGRDFQQQRAGVRQSYRSVGGESNTSVAYDRSTLTSQAFGRDTVDVYNAGYQRSVAANSFDASANRTLNTRDAGERSQFDRVFARHNYAGDGTFTAETLASYGATSQDLATLTGLKNEVTQLSTFATWRRADDDPLFATGGARLFRSVVASPLSETETRSAMGYGTLNYRVNPNLLLNGGGSVTQLSNPGTDASAVLAQEFAGATYTTDAHRLGQYLYYRQPRGERHEPVRRRRRPHSVASLQGTHGVNRLFDVAPAQSIALNLSQSLAHSHDTLAGNLDTLSNYGGLSYRLASAETLSGFASVSASDSRTRGFADSTSSSSTSRSRDRPTPAATRTWWPTTPCRARAGLERALHREPQRRRHLSAPARVRRGAAAVSRDLRAQRLSAEHPPAGRPQRPARAGRVELRAAPRVPHRQARDAPLLPPGRDRWQEKCFAVPADRA
jgi:hypothetical protein